MMSEHRNNRPQMTFPLVSQVLGLILAGLVLDRGCFGGCYFVASIVFWIWAVRYLARNLSPKLGMLYLIRWGPIWLFAAIMLLLSIPAIRNLLKNSFE
jgi:hypothetical protein